MKWLVVTAFQSVLLLPQQVLSVVSTVTQVNCFF